jgi:ATP-dependent Clp protease ATP-binding subunit ClpA
MPTFSQSLEQSLHRALAIANERHHQYATLEHLLLSLIDDSDAAAVMRACSVDLDKLRTSLVNYLETEFENLVTDSGDDAKPTAGFQRVIQRAVIHVQSSGREEVTGANVLIAIFAERESHAAYFLQEQDMTRYDAVNYISHGIAKRPGVSEARPVRGVDEETEAKGNEDSKKKGEALETYCVNLNKKARDGKIDPVIGRNAEINRAIQVLCRTTRCSSAMPASARPRSRKAWQNASSTAKCRKCWQPPPCSRSTWVRCSRARATAAISRSG